MRLADGRLAFSATDLSRHLACSHLTTLRRAVALGQLERPTPYDDPRGDVLKQRGIEHERRLLERFAAEGRSVEIVTAADTPFSHRNPAAAAARTRDAMRSGADVVYQGRLENEDGRWSGYPDFLLRVDEPSGLGAWSYEVLDAKLARSAKGEAMLQLLLYSDLLTLLQGTEPARMHLALGGDGRDCTSCRVVEYSASTAPSAGGSRPTPKRRPRPIRNRSSTAPSATGNRPARRGGAPTTTCRSWPASPAGSGAGSSNGG